MKSNKTKQVITKCLMAIESNSFDEDTIRTLLIVTREHIKKDGLIKELAHFIAHNDRNTGMFHRRVNSRYTKIKLVDDQFSAPDFKDKIGLFKTEEEYSNYALGAVNVDKIESRLFKILYEDGLDDLTDEHLKMRTNHSKEQIRNYFKKFYIQREDFHYLTTNRTEMMVHKLQASGIAPESTRELLEDIPKIRDAASRIRNLIDDLQKVIRGDIVYTSVFTSEDFGNEITNFVNDLCNKFQIEHKYRLIVKKKSDDILLCIMTLLHDTTFRFYDHNTARNFLSVYLDHDRHRESEEGYDPQKTMYEEGVLALVSAGKSSVTFPLFVSGLHIRNYLDFDNFCKANIKDDFKELPYYVAVRTQEELRLSDGSFL